MKLGRGIDFDYEFLTNLGLHQELHIVEEIRRIYSEALSGRTHLSFELSLCYKRLYIYWVAGHLSEGKESDSGTRRIGNCVAIFGFDCEEVFSFFLACFKNEDIRKYFTLELYKSDRRTILEVSQTLIFI